MLEKVPSAAAMAELLGAPLFAVWQELCAVIEAKYDMERLWNAGGKNWTYEYKYRRGGKTLCSLYAKSGCMGFMIIFGKAERAKVEEISGARFRTPSAGSMTRPKPTTTANGSCLNRRTPPSLMII